MQPINPDPSCAELKQSLIRIRHHYSLSLFKRPPWAGDLICFISSIQTPWVEFRYVGLVYDLVLYSQLLKQALASMLFSAITSSTDNASVLVPFIFNKRGKSSVHLLCITSKNRGCYKTKSSFCIQTLRQSSPPIIYAVFLRAEFPGCLS